MNLLEAFESELRDRLPDYYVDDGFIGDEPCIVIRQHGVGAGKYQQSTLVYLDDDHLTVVFPFKSCTDEELTTDDIRHKAEMRAMADNAVLNYLISDPAFDVQEVIEDIHRVLKHL